MHVIACLQSTIVVITRLIAIAYLPQVGWVRRASTRNYTVVVVRMLGISAAKRTSQLCMNTQFAHTCNIHTCHMHIAHLAHTACESELNVPLIRSYIDLPAGHNCVHRGESNTSAGNLQSSHSLMLAFSQLATRSRTTTTAITATFLLPKSLPILPIPTQRQGRLESLSCVHSLQKHWLLSSPS